MDQVLHPAAEQAAPGADGPHRKRPSPHRSGAGLISSLPEHSHRKCVIRSEQAFQLLSRFDLGRSCQGDLEQLPCRHDLLEGGEAIYIVLTLSKQIRLSKGAFHFVRQARAGKLGVGSKS